MKGAIRYQSGVLSFLLIACTGCQSMGGHLIQVDGTNVKKTRISGVPITIHVPTASVFMIKRSEYNLVDPVSNTVVQAGLTEDELLTPNPIPLGKTQVYSLDMKRPAAGTMDMTMELANQYPTKIAAKLDDQTIKTLSDAVSAQVDNFLKIKGAGPEPTVTGDEVEKQHGAALDKVLVRSSIYYVIFDLADPTREPVVKQVQ